MKVLCAVDGSKYSLRAIEVLGALFQSSLREVILVHVVDADLLELGLKKEGTRLGKAKKILSMLTAEGKNVLKAAEVHAKKVFQRTTGKMPVKVRCVVAKGHAAYSLVKEAEKRRPHMIVLGSRGFQDIQGYLMGSVSRKVLSHAPCPVFIVKDPLAIPVRVVLAVDGSTASTRAAHFLKTWMAPDVVSVHVLAVVPEALKGKGAKGRPQAYTTALKEAFQAQALETTAHVRSLLEKRPYRVTTEILHGSPRAAILESLVKREAGLAVLGAKGLTGPERFQMGSVSEWVAAYSGCSILVVRPHKK